MSVPTNPGPGVYVTLPSGSRASTPFLGPLTRTAASGSPSTSVSLASTPGPATASGVFRVVENVSLTATGGSFTGVTVIVTTAAAVPPLPSPTV